MAAYSMELGEYLLAPAAVVEIPGNTVSETLINVLNALLVILLKILHIQSEFNIRACLPALY